MVNEKLIHSLLFFIGRNKGGRSQPFEVFSYLKRRVIVESLMTQILNLIPSALQLKPNRTTLKHVSLMCYKWDLKINKIYSYLIYLLFFGVVRLPCLKSYTFKPSTWNEHLVRIKLEFWILSFIQLCWVILCSWDLWECLGNDR